MGVLVAGLGSPIFQTRAKGSLAANSVDRYQCKNGAYRRVESGGPC